MDTNTDPVLAHDELRVQAALLRTPEFLAQFDPDKFAGQLERIAAALAQQPAAMAQPAGGGCHCGTCTCNPNMTPAVRFDLSPAQMEGAIRDHLIALGWTPPGAKQSAAVDEAKETDLWRCTVCGRVGTVGRCCGEETRERANMESLQEVDMAITGGFGTTLDMERGTSRKWVMGSDGVKRWADSGLPCEPPSCDECEYCFPDEVRDGDDYVWKHYCNLAEPGGKAIEIDEGECCPDWCPLAMLDEHQENRNG